MPVNEYKIGVFSDVHLVSANDYRDTVYDSAIAKMKSEGCSYVFSAGDILNGIPSSFSTNTYAMKIFLPYTKYQYEPGVTYFPAMGNHENSAKGLSAKEILNTYYKPRFNSFYKQYGDNLCRPLSLGGMGDYVVQLNFRNMTNQRETFIPSIYDEDGNITTMGDMDEFKYLIKNLRESRVFIIQHAIPYTLGDYYKTMQTITPKDPKGNNWTTASYAVVSGHGYGTYTDTSNWSWDDESKKFFAIINEAQEKQLIKPIWIHGHSHFSWDAENKLRASGSSSRDQFYGKIANVDPYIDPSDPSQNLSSPFGFPSIHVPSLGMPCYSDRSTDPTNKDRAEFLIMTVSLSDVKVECYRSDDVGVTWHVINDDLAQEPMVKTLNVPSSYWQKGVHPYRYYTKYKKYIDHIYNKDGQEIFDIFNKNGKSLKN